MFKNIKNAIRTVKYFFSYYFYIIKTRNVDYFHYKKLAVSCGVVSWSMKPGILGNKCYGNWKAVKKAVGSTYNKHSMIEHGIYFGERILYSECEMPEISTIYTYSPYRVNVLKKYYNGTLNKEVISVGPYIKYSSNFHGEKTLKRIKLKYGKILLVFPSHPDPTNNTLYDFEEFIREIDRISEEFDSVFVSMFWVDIKYGKHKFYEEKGYIIVCSGNRFDPKFLSRQKDLIELSDMTMSNDMGTHIGYCISLNRPHYLFEQKVNFDFTNENQIIINDMKNTEATRINEYKKMLKTFGTYNVNITDEQRKIVKYYWGDIVHNSLTI